MITRWISLLTILAMQCGCTKTYWSNRGNDSLDVINIGVEYPAGINFAAKIGPIGTGLGKVGGFDTERSSPAHGYGIARRTLGCYWAQEYNFIFYSGRCLFSAEKGKFAVSSFANVFALDLNIWNAFGLYGEQQVDESLMDPIRKYHAWLSLFQLEASLGIGINARVGVNMAETMDFVFGWTTLDMLGDDQCGLRLPVQKSGVEQKPDISP